MSKQIEEEIPSSGGLHTMHDAKVGESATPIVAPKHKRPEKRRTGRRPVKWDRGAQRNG
jgi:hypothetical protein